MLLGCGKKTEEPAFVEEVPSFSTEYDTDTSAYLPAEPSLQAVGGPSGSERRAQSEADYSAQQAQFSDNGAFVVQVSVFKSRNQAENFMTRLADNGFPAYVAQVENPTADLPGTYHRVRIGRFRTISAAKAFGDNTLAAMGYSYWVDNKANDQVGSGSEYGGGYQPAPSSYQPTDSYSTPATDYSTGSASESYTTPSEPAAPAMPAEPAPSPSPWDMPREPEAVPSEPATSGWETPASTPEPEAPQDTSFNEGGFLDEW